MPEVFAKKSQLELWKDLFNREEIFPFIREAVVSYPEQRSVTISFEELVAFEPDFAEHVLSEPQTSLHHAGSALTEIARSLREDFIKLKVRLSGIPPKLRIQIRDLRGDHISKFVSIHGLLRKVTEVRPKLKMGAFRCVCGHIQRIPQHADSLTEPFECSEDEGGCGKKGNATKFTLLMDQSKFIDSQKIEIQESPDNLRGGAQPERITAYIEDDITGLVAPGDEVTLNGILNAKERRRGMVTSTVFDIVLDINSVELEEGKSEDVEISDIDILTIKELAQDPKIYEMMVNSIAPTIYGMEIIKQALVLQLFGGVKKHVARTDTRGDIHVLLIGDPGTAKSQLLRFISDLSPRGIFASGQAATKAGLTATAVKDDFGEGRWTLEAGALVLADRGIACVDELDKMSKEDRSSMHEALEQQRISIAKAGITATLQCRCSLLAAANPKAGRFDTYKDVYEQINLPTPLITRFDVIFPIFDEPGKERDNKLARKIIRVHTQGEMNEFEERREDMESDLTLKQLGIDPLAPDDLTSAEIDFELLRKYVAYAKRNVFPILTEDSRAFLTDYYVGVRNKKEEEVEEGEGKKGAPITARQLEAFIRLAEASAKVRLSPLVERKDVERAIEIVRAYIEGMTRDKVYDADAIEVGSSRSQQAKIRLVLDIIRQICRDQNKLKAKLGDIIDVCEANNIAAVDAERLLEVMRERSLIYRSKDEYGAVNQY